MGALEEKGPECLKRPKTTYTTIRMLKNSPSEPKWAHFRYILVPPGSHPGTGFYGARRGRSLPVPPGFPSHASPPDLIYSISWVGPGGPNVGITKMGPFYFSWTVFQQLQ